MYSVSFYINKTLEIGFTSCVALSLTQFRLLEKVTSWQSLSDVKEYHKSPTLLPRPQHTSAWRLGKGFRGLSCAKAFQCISIYQWGGMQCTPACGIISQVTQGSSEKLLFLDLKRRLKHFQWKSIHFKVFSTVHILCKSLSDRVGSKLALLAAVVEKAITEWNLNECLTRWAISFVFAKIEREHA